MSKPEITVWPKDPHVTDMWAREVQRLASTNPLFNRAFGLYEPKPLTRKQKLKRLWHEITYRVSGAWDVLTGKAYVSHGEEW